MNYQLLEYNNACLPLVDDIDGKKRLRLIDVGTWTCSEEAQSNAFELLKKTVGPRTQIQQRRFFFSTKCVKNKNWVLYTASELDEIKKELGLR